MLMPAQPATTITSVEPETVQFIEVKTPEPKTSEEKPKSIEELVREKARSSNLNEDKVLFITKCESELDPTKLGDGNLTCPSTGRPMRSRGLWQINQCYHPEVSDKQAFDPEWSTNWAIKMFKKGTDSQEWLTCSRKYTRAVNSDDAEHKSDQASRKAIEKGA
jgi:hypothetical protein